MIWFAALLAWLTLGAALLIRDVRKLPRKPSPWPLEYREFEIRDRLALRDREAP